MECKVLGLYEAGTYRYVVNLTRYEGKIVLSRHHLRATWETQGGHIEPGETPIQAARRELHEECGAIEYEIVPLCDYWAGDEQGSAYGMVFSCEVHAFGPLPENSEMSAVAFFDALPEELTYPDITPKLFSRLWEEETPHEERVQLDL